MASGTSTRLHTQRPPLDEGQEVSEAHSSGCSPVDGVEIVALLVGGQRDTGWDGP